MCNSSAKDAFIEDEAALRRNRRFCLDNNNKKYVRICCNSKLQFSELFC